MLTGKLTDLDFMGCHSKRESRRYWGHSGAANVSSLLDCAQACKSDSGCRWTTYDPEHRAGNPNYNCWLFKNIQSTTNEPGFTSVECSRKLTVTVSGFKC